MSYKGWCVWLVIMVILEMFGFMVGWVNGIKSIISSIVVVFSFVRIC